MDLTVIFTGWRDPKYILFGSFLISTMAKYNEHNFTKYFSVFIAATVFVICIEIWKSLPATLIWCVFFTLLLLVSLLLWLFYSIFFKRIAIRHTLACVHVVNEQNPVDICNPDKIHNKINAPHENELKSFLVFFFFFVWMQAVSVSIFISFSLSSFAHA